MQKRLLIMIFALASVVHLIFADNSEVFGASPANLNLIPTAESLGKGGYSFSLGAFHYELTKRANDPVRLDIGDYLKERHGVELQTDIWLIPTRVTYGISERLDFTFGGTYSAGDSDKIVSDYYEMGDDGIHRTYSQLVTDGILGMKYVFQEGVSGLPDLAVGSEVQVGYTVDEELSDETPGDSLRFIATQIYMSISQDFRLVSLHGGAGVFVSSKTVESDDEVEFPIQAGLEAPFETFAIVIDVTLFNAFSGIGKENIVSGGFRYSFSPRARLNASYASTGGFLVRLTVNGRRSAM